MSYNPTKKAGPIFTAGGMTFSLDPSYYPDSTAIPAIDINIHTITDGSSATTIDGTRIAFSDNSVYIGTKPYRVPTPVKQAPDPSGDFINRLISAASGLKKPALLTVGGETASIIDKSRIAIGSATITLGAHGITIDHQSVSFGTAGIAVGSVTVPVTDPAAPSTTVVDGMTFTAVSGVFVKGGATLSRGGSGVTVSGMVISVDSTVIWPLRLLPGVLVMLVPLCRILVVGG